MEGRRFIGNLEDSAGQHKMQTVWF